MPQAKRRYSAVRSHAETRSTVAIAQKIHELVTNEYNRLDEAATLASGRDGALNACRDVAFFDILDLEDDGMASMPRSTADVCALLAMLFTEFDIIATGAEERDVVERYASC